MASILVIDDDPQIRRFMRMLLESDGHSVIEAGDGKAGIATYKQTRPDLVVCDLFMPEKEGLETIQELRSAYPKMKVVAMSGGWGRSEKHDFLPLAKRFGANGLLAKPFDAVTLANAVSEALGAGV